MKLTHMNNFCRVFKLPDTFPGDYCFGGGQVTTMMMLDWFNPFSNDDIMEDIDEEMQNRLIKFVSAKEYISKGDNILILIGENDNFLPVCFTAT